ncbi:MAG TPA: dicarboxylate/amino acid:cation symporter [Phycisphaerales bacterium]|nr:dicarboxylate/amino acid:cation symporter [Phycisphaerales bacterium]
MKLALHYRIMIGMALGIVVGLALNQAWDAQTWSRLGVGDAPAFLAGRDAPANASAGVGAGTVRFLVRLNDLVGRVFVRSLRFVAVPIVLFSLIVGAASLGDLRRVGRIGGRTLLLYIATTLIAVGLGLALGNLVRPGASIGAEARDRLAGDRQGEIVAQIGRTGEVPGLWDQLVELIPGNPFAALAHDTALFVRTEAGRSVVLGQGGMLQVIVVALAVGIGLTLIPREKARPVLDVCDALSEVMMVLVRAIMWLAPFAVFALLVPVVARLGLTVLQTLAVYAGTVLLGLALILLIEYPLLVWALARVRPGRFFRAMAPAQLLAFSSSSSNATLPVTMQCVTRRLGVSEAVTSFVCPLGATVNMDGTALYQAIATLFIAQLYGIDLGVGQQLTILLTATLAAIGTPGIPGAGVLMLVIVLESVGIPPASIAGGIAVILGLDRILDMCRTVVNVTGDGLTAAIIARLEGEAIVPPADEPVPAV